MRGRYLFYCTLALLLSARVYAAQEADALESRTHPANFIYSGYVDASYNYLLRSNRFISGRYNRNYDLASNGFSLQQAALLLEKRPEQGFGAVFNPILGRDALQIAPYGLNPTIFNSKTIGFTIPQAYLQYKYDTLIVKAGELLSLAGLEQIDYTQNTNFSRSIIYMYAQPGTHIGFRLLNKMNKEISLILGINNGWNTVRQAGHFNTLEFGFSYDVDKLVSLTVDLYSGEQYLTDKLVTGAEGRRNLIDFFVTWYVTDKLSLATNFDYGIQHKALLPNGAIAAASWSGIAAYVNYTLNDKWLTSLRGELFYDGDGYRTGVRQNWQEVTVTLGYLLSKSLELRAETRHDFSNASSILNKVGTSTNNNQQSYALEMLYQFW